MVPSITYSRVIRMQGKDIIPTDPNAHVEGKGLPSTWGKCTTMTPMMILCDVEESAPLEACESGDNKGGE